MLPRIGQARSSAGASVRHIDVGGSQIDGG